MENSKQSTQPLTLDPTLLIVCRDIHEATFLYDHLMAYRREREASGVDELGDLGMRMLTALQHPFLRPIYVELLRLLLARSKPTHNWQVADELGLSRTQPGAMVAKLSARMKSILTEAEQKHYRSPIYVLIDVSYDDQNSSYYELTKLGARVVDAYLKSKP